MTLDPRSPDAGPDDRRPTVLIVEDEMLIATDLEESLEELGYRPVGIAADRAAALALAERRPDVALVDCNLRDGRTGPEIGQALGTRYGVAVLFLTANPEVLGGGVKGTLGFVSKPCARAMVAPIVDYALRARGGDGGRPPYGVTPFASAA